MISSRLCDCTQDILMGVLLTYLIGWKEFRTFRVCINSLLRSAFLCLQICVTLFRPVKLLGSDNSRFAEVRVMEL